jgi:hypothetical protein
LLAPHVARAARNACGDAGAGLGPDERVISATRKRVYSTSPRRLRLTWYDLKLGSTEESSSLASPPLFGRWRRLDFEFLRYFRLMNSPTESMRP